MAEQCDLFDDLIKPDELETVTPVTRGLIESRLMSIVLDKYAKHADVINSAKELNKMCGFNAPVKSELTGANGAPLASISAEELIKAKKIFDATY